MFNENGKISDHDSFQPPKHQYSHRHKKLEKQERPETVSNKIQTRNQSYNIGMKKTPINSEFKVIHQSRNLPKTKVDHHESSKKRKSTSKSKLEAMHDIEPFETDLTEKSKEY